MELSKQVVSLQLAKKMKEAGWPQNRSLFCWSQRIMDSKGTISTDLEYMPTLDREDHRYLVCAAPTVAELGEALRPLGVYSSSESYWRVQRYVEEENEDREDKWIWKNFDAETEADSRALCWLYLKEKELT